MTTTKIHLPSDSPAFFVPSGGGNKDRLLLLFGASSSSSTFVVLSAVPWKVSQLDSLSALVDSTEDALSLLPAGVRFVGFAQLEKDNAAALPTGALLKRFRESDDGAGLPLIDLAFRTTAEAVSFRSLAHGAASFGTDSPIDLYEIVDTNPHHTVGGRHLNSLAIALVPDGDDTKKISAFIIHPGNGISSSISSSSVTGSRCLNTTVFAVLVRDDEKDNQQQHQAEVEKRLLQSWRRYVQKRLDQEDGRLEREEDEAAERGVVAPKKRPATAARWKEASSASVGGNFVLRVRVDAIMSSSTSTTVSAAARNVVETVCGMRLRADEAVVAEVKKVETLVDDKKQQQMSEATAAEKLSASARFSRWLAAAPPIFWFAWVALVMVCVAWAIMWEQKKKVAI